MEALFILAGEVIALFLTVTAALVIEAILAVLPLVISRDLVGARQKLVGRTRWLKRAWLAMSTVFAVCLGLVLALNFFFFESTVRWGLNRIGQRNQVEIKFQSATGSLFKGDFNLKGVTAVRTNSAVSTFDLQAEEVQLDISAIRIWPFTPTIQELFIKGLKGDLHRLSVPAPTTRRRIPPSSSSVPKTQPLLVLRIGDERPPKNYRVEHFRMEDVNVLVVDTTQPEEYRFHLVLQELDSRPLRSRYALFDLLFHSNTSGTIEEKTFAIRTHTQGNQRRTDWEANALPVPFLGHYFGGPFHWLKTGTADVRVVNEWSNGPGSDINMQWSFGLNDLTVNAPTNAALLSRMLAPAIDEYIRRNDRKLDLSFGLTMNQGQFEGFISPDGAGLWDSARTGFTREFAKRSGLSTNQVEQTIQSGLNAVKGWFDRLKKPVPDADGSNTN